MLTSMRMTAKLCCATASRAARPESTSTTAWPSGASIARTASRLPALSSTTSTLAGDGASSNASGIINSSICAAPASKHL